MNTENSQTNTVKYWENIKKDCIREFCTKNTRNDAMLTIGGKLGLAILVELKNGVRIRGLNLIKKIEDDCVKAIELTDIRAYQKLVEICPDSFPNWIKSNLCTIDLTEKGWAFIKK